MNEMNNVAEECLLLQYQYKASHSKWKNNPFVSGVAVGSVCRVLYQVERHLQSWAIQQTEK